MEGIVRSGCGVREMRRGAAWAASLDGPWSFRLDGSLGCYASAPRTRDCLISGVVDFRWGEGRGEMTGMEGGGGERRGPDPDCEGDSGGCYTRPYHVSTV